MSSMPKVALDTLKLGLEIVLKVNVAFKSVILGIYMCFKTFCFVLISFYAVLRGLFTFLKMSGLALRASRKIFSRGRKTGRKKCNMQQNGQKESSAEQIKVHLRQFGRV